MARGYRCHECPDDTRDERGCSRPRRDGGPARVGAPGCPVEEVPGWYWRLCDFAGRARRGWDRPETEREAQEIEHLEAAQAQARAAEAEADRQREEMRERARRATGAG